MASDLIYAFRVMRLPLLDAGGNAIGRLDDVVVIPASGGIDSGSATDSTFGPSPSAATTAWSPAGSSAIGVDCR